MIPRCVEDVIFRRVLFHDSKCRMFTSLYEINCSLIINIEPVEGAYRVTRSMTESVGTTETPTV